MNVVIAVYLWMVGLVCFACAARDAYYADSAKKMALGLFGVGFAAMAVAFATAMFIGGLK